MKVASLINTRLLAILGLTLALIAPAQGQTSQPVSAATPEKLLPKGALFRLGQLRFSHVHPIGTMVHSGDGKILAAATHRQLETTIHVWNAATGAEIASWPGSRGPNSQLVFTDNDKTLLELVRPSNVVAWDPLTGKKKWSVSTEGRCYNISASTDGRWMCTFIRNADSQLWDLKTRKVVKALPKGWMPIISPDGKKAVLIEDTKAPQLRLIDLASGKDLRPLEEMASKIIKASFSADSKRLVVGSNKRIIAWNLETDDKPISITPDKRIASVEITSDGKFAVAGNYWTITAFDLSGEDEALPKISIPVKAVKMSIQPGSRTIIIDSGSSVRQIDIISRKKTLPDNMHGAPIRALAFGAGGNIIASGSDDSTVRVWDTRTGKQLSKLPDSENGVVAVAISADGKTLASGGADHKARLWDWRKGRLVHELTLDKSLITDMLFTADRRRLRIANNFGAITDLDLTDRKTTVIRKASTNNRQSRSILSRPSGCMAMVVTRNQALMWKEKSTTDRELPTIARSWSIPAFVFDPRHYAVACQKGPALGVTEIASGDKLLTLTISSSSRVGQRVVTAIAYSPDGRVLATSTYEGAIKIIDAVTGKTLHRFMGHKANVRALEFTKDGRLLASGSDDNTIVLWSMKAVTIPPAGGEGEDTFAKLWERLISKDASTANVAMWTLIERKDEAVKFLAQQLKPEKAIEDKQIIDLIAELDSRKYAARQRAQVKLDKAGALAEKQLKAALGNTVSGEVRLRITALLDKLKPTALLTEETLRCSRSVCVLETIATPAARKLLENLSGGAPLGTLTHMAKDTLRRMNSAAGKTPTTGKAGD